MGEIKIRPLKVDDVFPMVEILGKVIATIAKPRDATGEALSCMQAKHCSLGIAKAREEIGAISRPAV